MYRYTIVCALLILSTSIVHAFDAELFNKLAENTIKQVKTGVVGDIDAMLKVQEELMMIGIAGGIEFMRSDAKNTKPLKLVIENAENMKDLSLAEMESLWHGGAFFKSKEVDLSKLDHFGPMVSLMDSVIHPATSYLLLKEYKRTGNSDFLIRIKAELFEVLEHVKSMSYNNAVQHSVNQ